jgi:3',5'-cyclic AMP phosphodiesterase CpdA
MRFALLSDLHFGRARADLVQPLLDVLDREQPDLVVVAGDFVQRARKAQFAAARAFLDRLPAPWLAVPGNHDIPLFDLPERLFAPRSAYRRWISEETEPLVRTPEVLIAGLDTTERLHHQRGTVTDAQISRIADLIAEESAERTVVVVAHHPFHQDPGIEKKLMIGAPDALEVWAEAGPHMIVSGHLHVWAVEPFVSRRAGSMTLQIHCGTGLSTRLRGHPNDVALIEVEGAEVLIERFSAGETARFEAVETLRYARGPKGWRNAEDAPE